MKKTISFKTLLPALAITLLVSCAQPEQKLVIVSTNDIHASIDNFSRLATLVDELRAENPGHFILIDAGDRWTGNPYVDRAPWQGKPIIDLMNTLGYDLATFGNHEWDFGVDTLAERMSEARFTRILANADMSATSTPPTPPYVVVYHGLEPGGDGDMRGMLRAAYLGMVTTAVNGHPDGFEYNFGETKFHDFLETAEKHKHLADENGLYVVVSHLGLESDSILAALHPEIDLIIGGHSHDLLPNGKKVNNTLITQTGSRLRYAGVTTVTYRKSKVRKIENHVVLLDTIAPAAAFEKAVEEIYDDPALKLPVGSVAGHMGETALMNLFSDIMKTENQADFAFYNMGGMRLEELPEGIVTNGDMYAAEPFGNRSIVHEMTLEDIKELILNKFNSEGKESHTLDMYPSGMTYKMITDGEGNGTDIFFSHKLPNEAGRRYKVALSDYVTLTYHFPQRGQGEPSAKPIADIAIDYMKRYSPVKVDETMRVEIE